MSVERFLATVGCGSPLAGSERRSSVHGHYKQPATAIAQASEAKRMAIPDSVQPDGEDILEVLDIEGEGRPPLLALR